MNGPLAQLVAIALHGSSALSGRQAAPDFLGKNSTAQFCESIRFVRVTRSWFGVGRPVEVEVSSNPDAWFDFLRAKGGVRVLVQWKPNRASKVPDRMFAGFVGGGGEWELNVRYADGHCERWLPSWEVHDRSRADRRIWRVRYVQVFAGKEIAPSVEPTSIALSGFVSALEEIRAFSAKKSLDWFTNQFGQGVKALQTSEAVEYYHKDLWPEGFISPTGENLLKACQCSWVFGGMGSWNDMMFDGEDGAEYERVSEQLFKALTVAIPSAVASNANG